jgi:predicted glycogen debranching enzyme
MTAVSREISLAVNARSPQPWEREWLVTNGLGGYASGTVSGALTRRYHGLLIAAYPPPLGRIMIVNRITESVRSVDGNHLRLNPDDAETGAQASQGIAYLAEFRLEDGLPVWSYQIGDAVIEKRIILEHRHNTTHLVYRLISGAQQLQLRLRPELNFRPHDAPADLTPLEPYRISAEEAGYLISCGKGAPQLRLALTGGIFTLEEWRSAPLCYPMEQERGYDCQGQLWSPGFFDLELSLGVDLVLSATTESWESLEGLPPLSALGREGERRRQLIAAAEPGARSGFAAELILAADQFLITPPRERQESAGKPAPGEKTCSVIAGYHWFTAWGRDTMISLEGLTLVTGRHDEARRILRGFASYVRAGLIPNLFPEGESEGAYNTADASLWFIHAVGRYLACTGDRDTLRLILPQLREIIDRHLIGTAFGIGMDHGDGLLRQGAPGYQLTWMDAKVGDWVVTPRRGKAVELNALWYNALRLMGAWCAEEGDQGLSRRLEPWADRAYSSFNERFWYPEGGYLYDVVDGESGDDSSLRPNQLIALSLCHPVLKADKWARVLRVVRERLVTRVGLRTLAPGSPDYQATYQGDLRARDAAYHQGTVWPWLLGPLVDAWLRCYPEQKGEARGFLEGLEGELDRQCIGTIGEIYDAEEPHHPRGCVAQAWSVAEVLRCWLKTGHGEKT